MVECNFIRFIILLNLKGVNLLDESQNFHNTITLAEFTGYLQILNGSVSRLCVHHNKVLIF